MSEQLNYNVGLPLLDIFPGNWFSQKVLYFFLYRLPVGAILLFDVSTSSEALLAWCEEEKHCRKHSSEIYYFYAQTINDDFKMTSTLIFCLTRQTFKRLCCYVKDETHFFSCLKERLAMPHAKTDEIIPHNECYSLTHTCSPLPHVLGGRGVHAA